MTDDRYSLRTIFNEAAQEYDAMRPGYPEALIEDILTLSDLPQCARLHVQCARLHVQCARLHVQGVRLLEIGCGTGQASLPFARRGYKLLCLDIGPDMIALAAQNLSAYPNVRFRNVSFEKWPARLGAYDLIFSATAFHWIPREIGYAKAALALKPGGSLAVFWNRHPRPGQGFFVDMQQVYRRILPETPDPADGPTIEQEIEEARQYINSTGLFASLEIRTYPWSQVYTTGEYVRLINTYSGHRALPPDRRQALEQGIAEMIEDNYGGRIQKDYLAVLYLARKAPLQARPAPGKRKSPHKNNPVR